MHFRLRRVHDVIAYNGLRALGPLRFATVALIALLCLVSFLVGFPFALYPSVDSSFIIDYQSYL